MFCGGGGSVGFQVHKLFVVCIDICYVCIYSF